MAALKVPHLGKFFEGQSRAEKLDNGFDTVGVLHLIDVALQRDRQHLVLLKNWLCSLELLDL